MANEQNILEKILEQMKDGEGWAGANKPFSAPLETKIASKVTKVSPDSKMKELKAIKTGTFLDMMFINANEKPIGGIPIASNSILTGLPNSGKSLLIDEIALRMSNNGYRVALVLSEEIFRAENSERYDLESRLKEKAKSLQLNWETIAKSLFVIDTVTNAELRDWSNFVTVYRNLAETNGVDVLLIDSMTLLEDVRGQIKYRVLELMRYNQTHGITSILISQRSIEEADTLAIAGGIGLSHIVDTVFILDYKKISSWDGQIKMDIPQAKQGANQNFFRIIKCRLCRFNARYFGYEITKEGFVRLQEPKREEVESEIVSGSLFPNEKKREEVKDGEIISGFPVNSNKKKEKVVEKKLA